MRKHLSTILKIAITVGGLIYVWTQVPLSEVQAEITDLRWSWIIVSLALIVISLVVRAYRWYVLLQGLKANIRFKRLVELYFVGNFFNNFLPSGFGGDVVRVIEAAQNIPTNMAAGTVIVDRLAGLLMLFVMALAALPFRPDNFPPDLAWQITAVSLAGLIIGFGLLDGRLIQRWGHWLPGKLSVTDPDQPLAKLLEAVRGCGWPAIIKALGVSVVFNFILCSWWFVCGLAIERSLPFSYYLLVIPILSVLLLVPSIGGLGVRESVAPLLFASAGLTAAEAVTLSLIVTILTRISGLFGGPVYIASLLRKRETKTAVSEAGNR